MAVSNKIKLMIIDDHHMVRESYCSFFKDDEKIEVIGEAENGKQLLELLETLYPDVVMLDHSMSVMDGRETLINIRKKFPDLRVIIVSMYYDDSLITNYFHYGANAFITKGSRVDLLRKAIISVNETGIFQENLDSHLITKAMNPARNKHGFDFFGFSENEYQVMKLVCKGLNNKEISEELKLSKDTVFFHKKNIYKKTNTHTEAGIAMYATSRGMFVNDKNILD